MKNTANKNKTLFLLCWILYFVSYIGRKNYPAVMSQMITEGFLTASLAGSINTIFFISYASGQLINGFLGDRLRADRLILIGTLLGGVCNLLMGISPSYHPMPLIWAVNGYALSMLWAPILRLFSKQMEPEECTRYTVHMSTAVCLGAVGSSLLCALFVSLGSWRLAFIASAIMLLLPGLFWWIRSSAIISPSQNTPAPSARRSHSLRALLTIPMLLIMAAILIQGMLRDGITSWVPTMITSQFRTPPSLSILMSTLLPVINLIGPYAAHRIYRKWDHSEIRTSGLFFIIALISLILIRISGNLPVLVTVLLFAVITTAMEAVNVMFLSILPLRYASEGRTATMTGLFNFLTYIGSAVSAFSAGLIVDHFGWSLAIMTWILLAALGITACLLQILCGRHR